MKDPLADGVVLSFLAPAVRCNQNCPACYLTEVTREPVREASLTPADYGRFLQAFLDAGVSVQRVTFQGYEVTLPLSWPYVEAVFEVAQRHRTRRSFITNGMLLHKHTESIRRLQPARIAVSLDGATADVHDPLRGLPGAWDATHASLKAFLEKAPEYRRRMSVVSCLYGERNFRSLFDLPPLLRTLGIPRWGVAVELAAVDGVVSTVGSRESLRTSVAELADAASAAGVRCHVNDRFGFLDEMTESSGEVESSRTKQDPLDIRGPCLVRLDPLGTVRCDADILTVWDPSSPHRWEPTSDDPVGIVAQAIRSSRVVE